MDMVLKTCQDTLHVIIQLCQRNSRRMDENEREVSKKHSSEVLFGLKFAKEKGKGGGGGGWGNLPSPYPAKEALT